MIARWPRCIRKPSALNERPLSPRKYTCVCECQKGGVKAWQCQEGRRDGRKIEGRQRLTCCITSAALDGFITLRLCSSLSSSLFVFPSVSCHLLLKSFLTSLPALHIGHRTFYCVPDLLTAFVYAFVIKNVCLFCAGACIIALICSTLLCTFVCVYISWRTPIHVSVRGSC